MIRILVIGDPHIKSKDIEMTNIMMKDCLDLAEKTQPNAIVVLGDTLHNHERIHSNPLSRAVDFLGRLSDISPLYLLIGNHDLRNNQVYLDPFPEHGFTALKRWPKVKVIDAPLIFDIGDLKFGAVPYVPPGRFKDAILPFADPEGGYNHLSAIFAHQEFRSANLGSSKSTVGDLWDKSYPLCISGHIHEYHQLAENIIYVGTPMQQNFGESTDKAISLFTWSSPLDRQKKPEHERLKLVNVPIRKEFSVMVSDQSTLSSILDDAKAGGSMIKITVSGTPEELKLCFSTKLMRSLKAIPGVYIVQNPLSGDYNPEDLITETKENKEHFLSMIYNAVEGDEEMRLAFHRLFGEKKAN